MNTISQTVNGKTVQISTNQSVSMVGFNNQSGYSEIRVSGKRADAVEWYEIHDVDVRVEKGFLGSITVNGTRTVFDVNTWR